MLTRPHSPGIWGVYTGAACFVGMVAVTVVWNIVDRRHDLRAWLKL